MADKPIEAGSRFLFKKFGVVCLLCSEITQNQQFHIIIYPFQTLLNRFWAPIFSSPHVTMHLVFHSTSRRRKKFLELKPQTLCPPQDITFCPLYSYKYSIFLWVTCSYRKECSLKKQWVAGCSLPSFACSCSCLFNLYLLTSQYATQPPTNSRQKTVAQPSPKMSCHKKNSTQIILKRSHQITAMVWIWLLIISLYQRICK